MSSTPADSDAQGESEGRAVGARNGALSALAPARSLRAPARPSLPPGENPVPCHGTGDGEVRPRFAVGDILREAAAAYLATHTVTPDQAAALRAITLCRTAALGGHVDECLACGHTEVSYNSCRNRHCPRCQWKAQERWIEARSERVLETTYFHVVLTLPAPLRALALTNPRPIYDLLFRAASRTLIELGRDPKRLGADLGITMVLHTWTRALLFHPHVHCLVTGGGLSLDGTRWISASEKHLLPVAVISALFRGKFLAGLKALHRKGALEFTGCAEELAEPGRFQALLDELYEAKWVTYAKRAMGGARHVLKYLGRYTHRVAISNARILDATDQHVVISTRDGKTSTLSHPEFLRRFLLHVLPKGFTKIRHYGLFAAANIRTKWAAADEILGHPAVEEEAEGALPVLTCSQCGSHHIVRRLVEPVRACGARGPPLTSNPGGTP